MEQPRHRPVLSAVLVPLIVGITALVTLNGRARFHGYATVDVLELLASGMCFGIALAGLVRLWRGRDGA